LCQPGQGREEAITAVQPGAVKRRQTVHGRIYGVVIDPLRCRCRRHPAPAAFAPDAAATGRRGHEHYACAGGRRARISDIAAGGTGVA